MAFVIGVGLWVAAGVAAAWLAVRISSGARASPQLTILWAVLGAMIGGLIGVIPYIPERALPWQPAALAGALIGGMGLSLPYRLVSNRSRKAPRASLRALAAVLIGVPAAALAFAIWFLLAVATPRLYRVDVNPDLPQAVALESLDVDALRARMAQLAAIYLMRPENAGITIAVTVRGRRTVLSSGVASKASGRALDEKSVFEIGSVTKTFTGVALADAITAGATRADMRVVELLGDRAPRQLSDSPIRVIDLATHSAGLPEYPAAMPWWFAITSDNPYDELSEAELLSSLAEAVGTSDYARTYRYSNFGFVLLGYLLESTSELSYPRLLDERIFRPLGMAHTQVPVGAERPDGLVDGHALGRPMPHWTGHRFAGAAGIVSSASDLLTFVEAHLHPETTPLAQALTLAMTDQGAAWGERRIGFAWHMVVEDSTPRIIYHTGNTLGFYAYVGFSPQTEIGVVVLGNSSDPTPAAIGDRLVRALNSAVQASLAGNSRLPGT